MSDLFTYMDFRGYLRDRCAEEKERNRHFSFRYFARIAGFSSPGFLKMVMDGQRNLTPESINQFCKAFKLNKKESAYFEALVLFNQAHSDRERDLYFERLTALKPPSGLKGLEKDQYEYFTQTHFVTLREMVALPDFREDPKWISERIRPKIKPKEVERSIEVLLRLGLLKRNAQGKLAHADTSITTPAEVDSAEIYNYHQTMLVEAKRALFEVPPSLRDITSLTIPIPKNSMSAIKEKIKSFREEIIDMINKGSADYHEVYQLNIQLFPVTQTSEMTKEDL